MRKQRTNLASLVAPLLLLLRGVYRFSWTKVFIYIAAYTAAAAANLRINTLDQPNQSSPLSLTLLYLTNFPHVQFANYEFHAQFYIVEYYYSKGMLCNKNYLNVYLNFFFRS